MIGGVFQALHDLQGTCCCLQQLSLGQVQGLDVIPVVSLELSKI